MQNPSFNSVLYIEEVEKGRSFRIFNAEVFAMVNPFTACFIAISAIFPERVKGSSGASTLVAGTCRGDVFCLISDRIFARGALFNSASSRRITHSRDRLVISGFSTYSNRINHLENALQLTLNLGSADPHAAQIKRRIRTPEKAHGTLGSQFDKGAMAPDIPKAFIISPFKVFPQ